jgi:hypothetical protein
LLAFQSWYDQVLISWQYFYNFHFDHSNSHVMGTIINSNF